MSDRRGARSPHLSSIEPFCEIWQVQTRGTTVAAAIGETESEVVMNSQFVAGLLAVLLALSVSTRPAFAHDLGTKVNRVRSGVMQLGIGPDARVDVRLKDRTRVMGYVSEIGEQGFTVIPNGSGASVFVAYPQVGSVTGTNAFTKKNVAITLAVFAAILVIAVAAANSDK
jgi:hypothetical protein